ncbi:MAG TPA: hypothetical protein V6D21_19275 [Candidatus Obscuribacterales bacterium]
MFTETLKPEDIEMNEDSVSDIDLFIDLYSRVGIKLKPRREGNKYFLFLPFGSVICFNETGQFISQYLGR